MRGEGALVTTRANPEGAVEAGGVRAGPVVLAAVVLWLVFVGPAWALAGGEGVLGLSIAGGLCFVPGLVATVIASRTDWIPHPLGQMVVAMMLRMVVALGGLLVVRDVRPDWGFREFAAWLVLYYLGMLGVETYLGMRPPGRRVASGG